MSDAESDEKSGGSVKDAAEGQRAQSGTRWPALEQLLGVGPGAASKPSTGTEGLEALMSLLGMGSECQETGDKDPRGDGAPKSAGTVGRGGQSDGTNRTAEPDVTPAEWIRQLLKRRKIGR